VDERTGEAQLLLLRKKVTAIVRRLRVTYGRHSPSPSSDPTDSLVATILSQHTSDRNSHAAFAELKRRYPTWDAVAAAHPEALASVIRAAGLANLKSWRILRTLSTMRERYGSHDLRFLADMPVDEGREVLRSMPGVGPKTAACVLLFACNKPALPVDTHVHRVSRRLGVIGPRDSAEKAHEVLQQLLAPEDVYDLHVDLIAHGRRICRARDPKCPLCPLQALCDYYQGVIHPRGEERPA